MSLPPLYVELCAYRIPDLLRDAFDRCILVGDLSAPFGCTEYAVQVRRFRRIHLKPEPVALGLHLAALIVILALDFVYAHAHLPPSSH